ncbi:MAG: baseplate J/gp47 family protein [Deferribacteraceae bacterium]|jgi:uncharacterized phage protein gp47/JayE|nr:baseplate J/gp47 family protein [Deferribacteraceae bacterium]
MKPIIDQTGIQIQTFQEIYDELAGALKEIYGADINLEQSTPDGQRIGIEAKLMLDLQAALAALYNELDPDFAAGQALNRLIKLCGIRRKPAARSSVDVTITAQYNLTLPINYTVQDINGKNWVTASEYTLTQGINAVTMHSEEWGNIDAGANTINKPVTVILGVQSVTNPEPAIPGANEETDQQLRLRRNRSLENAAYSSTGSLYAKLYNISGVTKLKIYENSADIYNDTLSLNPHSLWIIIEGGDISDIGEIIAKNKTAGTGLKGGMTATFTENIYKPDGTMFYMVHTMSFDRPVLTQLYIRVIIKRKLINYPVDTEAIKESIERENDFDIAENAVVTSLYAAIYKAGNTFIASELQISRDGVNWSGEFIEAGAWERFVVSYENIEITEII